MNSFVINEYKLKFLNEADALNFHELIKNNHERLKDFFAGTVAQTKTPEDTVEFIKNALQRHYMKEYYPYAIYDSNDRTIGYIDIKNIDIKVPKAEIGFFIDEQYASKGLVTGFLLKILDHFFLDLNFEKMYLRTHEGNMSARKVASKLGFKEEGKIRSDYKTTGGQLVDLLYFGKLKNEHKDH